MKPSTRISLRLLPRLANGQVFVRPLHSTVAKPAHVDPIVGTGPPPEPPIPSVQNSQQRIARRIRQAEMLKNAAELRSSKGVRGSALKKRFWKDVVVKQVDEDLHVYLDTRALRHPQTKEIVRIPRTKPDLASALALEWDLMSSSLDATRQHLIPLTSLVCRAVDIAADDASETPEEKKIRTTIATSLLRYFDTDSVLCWAAPAGPYDTKNDAGESLRDVQKRTTEEVVLFLTTHVWPGITIRPVLDGHAIIPQRQAPGTREVIQGWIMGLDAWEIAGLERAVLAGKSLLAGARFITEWSEGPVGKSHLSPDNRFGVEEAAKVTSLEVDWQTTQWGEVEDTHDVAKEDVRRQLGSVALLVAGTGKGGA
ncbi:hypothetical protein G7046_g2994 [Stylonectria norvegica]|nr:hypothetical protein G7046_g2994 [Stylonectria norvegica]